VIFLSQIVMNLENQFNISVSQSKELTVRPTNETLLKLYALFKQSTEGDVSGERPAGFDFKGAAKFDAWHNEKGKSAAEAMREYINLVNSLHEKESSN